MKLIRIFFYAVIFSMIFHQTVSAHKYSTPFTSTPPFYFSAGSFSSKIISFNSIINKKKVLLSWTVGTNEDTDRFEVEKSTDGKKFKLAGLIFGSDKAGIDYYQFYEKMKKSGTHYRVKTIAKDGSFNYSQIIIAG
jgi:hypothetical protein